MFQGQAVLNICYSNQANGKDGVASECSLCSCHVSEPACVPRQLVLKIG